jgi:hypothetical protein
MRGEEIPVVKKAAKYPLNFTIFARPLSNVKKSEETIMPIIFCF